MKPMSSERRRPPHPRVGPKHQPGMGLRFIPDLPPAAVTACPGTTTGPGPDDFAIFAVPLSGPRAILLRPGTALADSDSADRPCAARRPRPPPDREVWIRQLRG